MRIQDELLERLADDYVKIKEQFEKEYGFAFEYNLEEYIHKMLGVV